MVVYGERRPSMDVLAGATTTRIEVDERLLEGARIDELLAETPGVQVRRFGGLGARFEISIRGSRPQQVPVFLDGFRVDSSLSGRSDLSSICLDLLEEIDVTRGAGAARFGSGAIGGVVSLSSRRPKPEPETRVRGAVGSFETVEGSLRHSRRIGPWDLSLGYCGLHTEGDFKFEQARTVTSGVTTSGGLKLKRRNNEAERHAGLAQIGRSLGKGRLRMTQLLTHLDRGQPGLALVTAQRPRAEEEDLSTLSGLAFEHPVEAMPKGRFDLQLSHRFEDNHFQDPDPQPGSEPIDTETQVHGVVGNSTISSEVEALGGRHRLALLAEGRFDLRQTNEAATRSRASGAGRIEVESRWWNGRIRLAPSLRVERYDDLDTEWLPSVGLHVEPIRGLVVRGTAARSYRAPSFEELYLPDKGFESGNENLKPEEAWSYEIGATLESPFASPWLDFELEATYFRSEIDDSIVFQLVSPTRSSFVNSGRAETRGYEVAVRWNPHEWVRVTGSRTNTRARSERDNSPLPGVARIQTDARLELGPRDRFKLVGEVHHTGQIYVSSGGAAYLPSRITYNASAVVDLRTLPIPGLDRVGKAIWLSLRGVNLSDTTVYDTRAFPQPGRNFALSLEGIF